MKRSASIATPEPKGGASLRSLHATTRTARSVLLCFAFTVTLVLSSNGMFTLQSASATDYPSWGDVQNARKSEAAKKSEIATLQAIVAQLEQSVTTTQDDAAQKGLAWQNAQQNFDDAAFREKQLQDQAAKASAKAAKSKQTAGRIAAQQIMNTSSDPSLTLFLNGKNAATDLRKLGLASEVGRLSQGLFTRATLDKNAAQALTDQATRAKNALGVLEKTARANEVAAQAAAAAAAAALTQQQTHQAELNAQLATLITDTQHTEAEYSAGVQAQLAAGVGLAAGEISLSGYARPVQGRISSPFGFRIDPYNGVYRLHAGTDIAARCGTPMYAAHSGTVSYAGPYGGYGNFILIDDGDGISTAYAHIINGGILVQRGQQVSAGQNIARVGSTGDSTGCHLHFEVRVNGVATDAVPFMRARGVELAG